MTQLTAQQTSFEADFERFVGDLNEPAWLHDLRLDSIGTFRRLGMPTARHEDWLYTNLRPLEGRSFRRPDRSELVPAVAQSPRFGLGLTEGPRLVFVNGRWDPALSQIDAPPDCVVVTSIAEAFTHDARTIRSHLALVADRDQDALVALNTAFLEDGAYVRLPRGTVMEAPIQLLFLTSLSARDAAVYPRVLVVAEEDTEATILEDYVIECYGALGSGVGLTNAVTEIDLGANARLKHVRMQHEGPAVHHIGHTAVRQARGSSLRTTAISLGGATSRHSYHVDLNEEGAEAVLNGLYVITNEEHTDNHIVLHHRVPHCQSTQLYKGILGGRSRGAFTGRVVVHPEAQKTDANQANHNLLLSEDALAETRPQLEIYADDVKCNHGATIGQLDREALHYLRSRGLGPLAARNLLVHAFAGEITEAVGDEQIHEGLGQLLEARLVKDAEEAFVS